MDHMRAAVLEEPGGPFVLRHLPVPTPGENEVLIRVRACAVDRFDTAIRQRVGERTRLPMVLGHEIAGEVVASGPGAERWKPGERVVTSLYLTCGSCRWCRRGRETICERFGGHIGVNRPGGYAEFTVLPARNLVTLPESIDYPAGSLLANAVGTPLHALDFRMRLRPGERLLVTGAGGGVGLHAIQLGVLMGARVAGADIGASKLEAIRRMGAEVAVDPTTEELEAAMLEWTDGRGVDGVLELVGPATLSASLASLAKGGRLVIVGSHTGSEWCLDPATIYRNEWEILGSRNTTVEELSVVVDLVASGRIRPLVDLIRPLEEVEELHRRVLAGEVIGRDVLVP